MPVVSDTSPVMNLATIGRLSLLHEQYGDRCLRQGDPRGARGGPGGEGEIFAAWFPGSCLGAR